MKHPCRTALILISLARCATLAAGQGTSEAQVEQAILIAPGSSPFYLQAVITERGDPDEHVEVEMSWVAPDKWKRTIRSPEFSQTLIVNGDKIFEQDSDEYLPLAIQVLTTAMVDPRPILAAFRPGDTASTKANGGADESGKVCFGKMCLKAGNGLVETVAAPGRSVTFRDYRPFKNKRVARQLSYQIDPGDSYQAHVTTLGELTSDDAQFAIPEPTPKDKQIRSLVLPEAELRTLALQPSEIIWPQVLEDNETSGETSYYVSVDRSGQVREILPLSVSVERADDSARRQVMRWKFKPAMKDGVAVQAEAILNFHFDTRAYGPAKPLTDAEVRKLATNLTEPEFPEGSPSGSPCNIRIAVDAEGKVIEQIAVAGCGEASLACMKAIGKWQFSPMLKEGKPRPYRGEISFRVP
jgi:Gram-negative bacterial TonB protein C-terminal